MVSSLVQNVVGFASLGFFTRFWALGLQNRPLLERIHIHGAYMVVFGAFGYWLTNVEKGQEARLEKMREVVVERRRAKLAQEAS